MLMYSGGEGGWVIETDEDTDVEELVFWYGELLHESPLRRILKRWVQRRQIKRRNQLIDAWVQKGICWPENRMDVGFVMTLEINQLFEFKCKSAFLNFFKKSASKNKHGKKKQVWEGKIAYLSPSKVWRDKKLDISMLKDPQDHPP